MERSSKMNLTAKCRLGIFIAEDFFYRLNAGGKTNVSGVKKKFFSHNYYEILKEKWSFSRIQKESWGFVLDVKNSLGLDKSHKDCVKRCYRNLNRTRASTIFFSFNYCKSLN